MCASNVTMHQCCYVSVNKMSHEVSMKWLKMAVQIFHSLATQWLNVLECVNICGMLMLCCVYLC